MKALVIIPTYNERDNIESLARQVVGQAAHLSVLVVDDNSPDGTGRVVEKMAQEEPRVSILHRQSKQGLGTAYLAGFSFALAGDYDHVITMDGDFSHKPSYIPALIDAVDNADLAIGSRYVQGGSVRNWGLYRKLLSRSANCFARKMLEVAITYRHI